MVYIHCINSKSCLTKQILTIVLQIADYGIPPFLCFFCLILWLFIFSYFMLLFLKFPISFSYLTLPSYEVRINIFGLLPSISYSFKIMFYNSFAELIIGIYATISKAIYYNFYLAKYCILAIRTVIPLFLFLG